MRTMLATVDQSLRNAWDTQLHVLWLMREIADENDVWYSHFEGTYEEFIRPGGIWNMNEIPYDDIERIEDATYTFEDLYNEVNDTLATVDIDIEWDGDAGMVWIYREDETA